MTFKPRNTLQGHISKRHEESMNVGSHPRKAQTRKVLKNQPKVEFTEDIPPICHCNDPTPPV